MVEVTQELLPCPFCGGAVQYISNFGFPYIECEPCGVQFDGGIEEALRREDFQKAFDTWSTRHQPQPSAEQATVDRIVAWLRNDQGKGSEEGADWADAFADAIQRGDWK